MSSNTVQDAVDQWRAGHISTVPEGEAREIAAWWHSANGDGFAAFSHTGTVTNRLLDSIDREARAHIGELQAVGADGIYRESHDSIADNLNALYALRAYVKAIPHADYPHEPGRLYDCAACERECYCDLDDPGTTLCVHCG